MTRALIAAQLGDRTDAHRRLAAVAPLLASAPVDSEWLPMMAQAAEALALVDRPAEDRALHRLARELYEALHPYRGLLVVEGIGAAVRGPVHRHLGLLATVLGEPATAREHVTRALATARELGAPGLADRTAPEAGAAPPTVPDERQLFLRQGEFWQLRYAGAEVRLPDSKGLRDLAALLARPGTPVPALDLATGPAPPPAAGGPATGRPAAGTLAAAVDLHRPADTGELIDAAARTAYRRRLGELEEESADADAAGDAERSARIAVERDALVGQLTAAYGLGRRPRRTGSAAERARTTVTARIRAAVDRVERVHPALGRHLANAVHTGTLCVYEPEQPVRWQT